MSRRPKTLVGQMGFFDDLLIPEIPQIFTAPKAEEEELEEENEDEEVTALQYATHGGTIVAVKKKTRKVKYAREADPIKILEFGKPIVLLHKNGPYLLFKGADPLAAETLREAVTRLDECSLMRYEEFWDRREDQFDENEKLIRPSRTWLRIADWKKIELWRHLHGQVLEHPLCKILQELDVAVSVVPTLGNYIRKESARQEREDTPYPAPAINGEATLFERAGVGTVLKCIANYGNHEDQFGDEVPLFKAGNRYMVVMNEAEGKDTIRIAMTPMQDGVSIDATNQNGSYEWTAFHQPMESYFDDSEAVDLGETVDIKYPELVARMRKRLDDMGMALFTHQKIDAAMMSLKRGSVDAKLMRMGKSACAMGLVALWGSEKVAIFGGRNALVDGWQKEFKRVGITDYVLVETLSDLEKPAKYYLMTYGFIRAQTDPSRIERRDKENYLRGEYFHQRYPGEKTGQWVVSKASWLNHHPCPHCGKAMERPEYKTDATGKIFKINWTPANGYLCRNENCLWYTDNRKKRGTAWWNIQQIIHRGGYVDFGLAAHRDCHPDSIVGRKCEQCGETDGVWVPQITKRLKKTFSAVVVDEIHNAKDEGTLTAKAVYRMRPRRRHGMTGTLISNSVLDSYPVLRWILGKARRSFPYSFEKGKKEFDLQFCDHAYLQKPTGEIDEETGQQVTKQVRRRLPYLKNPPEWWRFSAPKVLRRNLSDPVYQQSLLDAGMCSPNCEIHTVTCPMLPAQARLMMSALKGFEEFYREAAAEAEAKGEDLSKMLVISQMTAMSIIATCPEWMNDRLDRQVYDGPTGGGKMFHIENLVRMKINRGGKVIVLSDYTAMQKAIEKQLIEFDPIRFVSTWDNDTRFNAFLEFRENPDKKLFVAGTRAISEGVDLSSADTVICADLLWSPAFQVQAWNRMLAPSFEQRNCDVYLMQSKNSIDEHKFATFYAKMVGADQALDRKLVNRRTTEFNVKWFAERLIEEEAHLAMQLREVGLEEEEEEFVPSLMSDDAFEERMV